MIMSGRARSNVDAASASLVFGAPVLLEAAVARIRAAARARVADASRAGPGAAATETSTHDRVELSSRRSSNDSFDTSDAGEGSDGWLSINSDEAEAVLAAAAAAEAVPTALGPLTLWEVRRRAPSL
eukprot:tig00000093_g3482.t1